MSHAIRVSDETWKRLKVEAAHRGIPLSKLVAEQLAILEVEQFRHWDSKMGVSRETMDQMGAALLRAQATQDEKEPK